MPLYCRPAIGPREVAENREEDSHPTGFSRRPPEQPSRRPSPGSHPPARTGTSSRLASLTYMSGVTTSVDPHPGGRSSNGTPHTGTRTRGTRIGALASSTVRAKRGADYWSVMNATRS